MYCTPSKSSLIRSQVVLADSSIVNANAQENPDLFWALKGGGPNFGKPFLGSIIV